MAADCRARAKPSGLRHATDVHPQQQRSQHAHRRRTASFAEVVAELERITRDAAAVDRTDSISVERLADRLYVVAEQFEMLAEPVA